MALVPSNLERLARARSDLRMGCGVVLCGNCSDLLIMAAESMSAERLNDLKALGDVALVITEHRARTLKIAAYDGQIARLKLPSDVHADWIHAMSDPSHDLDFPMKGPFQALRDGDPALSEAAIQLIKDAQLLPAAVTVALPDGKTFAADHDLTRLSSETIAAIARTGVDLNSIAHARLPIAASDISKVHVFRPEDGSVEHFAVIIGTPDPASPVLARLHSACFTGDVIGSLKCDCGLQLRGALAQMGGEGAGVLLYLNQEGRGIGLANKMRAYSLQNQGFDTVEANHRLGFEDDERDFRIGARILKELGFTTVRLLTNNPAKVARMEDMGINVQERVPLIVESTPLNEGYLRTKADKSGHIL